LKSTVSSLGTEQHDRRTELGLKDMGRIDGQECTNTLLVLVIHVVIIPFTTIDLQWTTWRKSLKSSKNYF
jgi:hypothetical protein